MGRRKVKMEMVEDINTRQVTFSKRRTGLFKKASELAMLCNADLGIVVFSPGGKPFSYGKPNLDSVAERFMREYDDSSDSGCEEESCNNRGKLNKMSDRLDLLNQETEVERKRGEKGQVELESAGDERFKKPIENLTLDELKEYKDKLQMVHGRIQDQANQMQASSSLIFLSRNKAHMKDNVDYGV